MSRVQLTAAVFTAAVVAAGCRPAPRPAVIGLGYRSQERAATLAGMLVDSGLERDRAIRITAASRAIAAGSEASEVDHAQRLASLPGLVGVVGHGGSREALLTAPIYNEAHVPQIVPTGTSRRLRDAGQWTFTLAPNDSVEGAFLGRFVAGTMHARSVTLFYVLDEYGAGLRDGVAAALAELGVRVIDMVPVPTGGECPPFAPANSFATAVDAALLRGRPDVIVLAARQRESGCIVARVHQRDPKARFIGGDGLIANADFRRRAGGAADSVFVVAFWHPERADSMSRAFTRQYAQRFGAIPTHDEAMVYDALKALIEAVRTVGPDGERVRGYLASLGHGRAALRGVTGPISFPGGAERLLMTRIRGTKTEVVSAS